MNNKTAIIIVIVLLLLVGGGVGAYYFAQNYARNDSAGTSATPTSQASPTISTSSSDTAIEADLKETDVTETDSDLKALESDINQL